MLAAVRYLPDMDLAMAAPTVSPFFISSLSKLSFMEASIKLIEGLRGRPLELEMALASSGLSSPSAGVALSSILDRLTRKELLGGEIFFFWGEIPDEKLLPS